MENHCGTDRTEIEPRLELALRESWNKSFQLFHAAARSTPKDGIAEAIRKLDLPILILRYAINNPLSPCTDRTPRKSISLSYRRREGESAARLANNLKIRWLWPITTAREWLIYAGVIKRISYTAGRRNKSGRRLAREHPGNATCYRGDFAGINGMLQKSCFKSRVRAQRRVRYDLFLISSRKLDLENALTVAALGFICPRARFDFCGNFCEIAQVEQKVMITMSK